MIIYLEIDSIIKYILLQALNEKTPFKQYSKQKKLLTKFFESTKWCELSGTVVSFESIRGLYNRML